MIKKLQKKFLIITMCSIIAVVFLLIGFINYMNYVQVDSDNTLHIELLGDNGANVSFRDRGVNSLQGLEPPANSPEFAFETRFFTVLYDDANEIELVKLDFIAAVDYDEAVALAEDVSDSSKKTGYKGNYKFLVVNTDSGKMVIFLDCSKSLWNVRQFLVSSILVSCLGILLVFGLVLFFAKKAVAPIAESYEKQKRFITDASHELKTPLSIIGANTDVIEMEKGVSEWTQSTKNQIERLSSLTNNLVFLSRMEEESYLVTKENINLSKLICREFEEFKSTGIMLNKPIFLTIEDNIYYKGNTDTLKKLCSILCENALKYASEGSQIEVILRKSGKSIEFLMKNQTTELKEGNQDVLFERFVRADASRNSKIGGNGIGLSVANAIVKAHKGKISARSEDGHSLTIRVLL